jgi:hypothetical protein
MAPSKRADNKGNITIYIDRKIIAKFREVCAFFGIPMSVIITSFMEHKIKEYEQLKRTDNAGDSAGIEE